MLTFTGPAKVSESPDDAVSAILTGGVVAGEVVVIRYEGPRGGPGMREMLDPNGDIVEIDVPARSIRLVVAPETLATQRGREGAEAFRTKARKRKVSQALRAYAAFTTSGAVRDVDRRR